MAEKVSRMVSMLFMVCLLLAFSMKAFGNSGLISYEMNQQMLGIACRGEKPLFISYEDMEEVVLKEAFDMGMMTEGESRDDGWCGVYENEEYGKYTLYAYSGTQLFIVVRYRDGVLVFNDKSRKNTEKIYETLTAHCREGV